jgi:hypothetical protein
LLLEATGADEKSDQPSQFLEPRGSPTNPIIVMTTPPTSIPIAFLSVGASVKIREMSELTEFEALTRSSGVYPLAPLCKHHGCC